MDANFIADYFVNPIINPEMQGYNLVNTFAYILLLIAAAAIIYSVLRKKIEFDERFFIAISPYILIGVCLRVIMHQIENGSLIIDGITKTANPANLGFWFFTPGVWILTFSIVVLGLIIATVWKELNYKRLFIFGLIIALPLILFNLSRFNNWIWFIGTVMLIAAVTAIICWIINTFTKYKLLMDPLNIFIIAGQAIDGIASVIAITFFGFSEQHVVSGMVINIHPALFSIIKLTLAVLICYSLDDYLNESITKHQNKPGQSVDRKNLIGFIKGVIAVLGFATGLASLLKMGLV